MNVVVCGMRDWNVMELVLKEELERAMRFLNLEMGLDLKDESKNIPINFTKDEINVYIKRFRSLDTDNKGYISITDLRNYFKVSTQSYSPVQWRLFLTDA